MIYYIASNVYSNSISEAINITNEIVATNIIGHDVTLLETLKKDISNMGNIDKLIIDLNALRDQDDEIIQALEMFRMMYDEPRVIILAAGHFPGDLLLTQCFQMGIYDIIAAQDFNIIKEELLFCIREGKKYKDSVVFKDAKNEKLIIKNEIKKNIYKVLIGMAGIQKHIGVTHSCILLANYLRQSGFRVAICEVMNQKLEMSDYEFIQDSFDMELFDNAFTLSNIDYYPNMLITELHKIDKPYNFIILDFGTYADSDLVMYNKCEIKMLVTGSKAYEIPNINQIFENATKESLKEYHFLFNLTDKSQYQDILSQMNEFKENVHFLAYAGEVFESSEFPDGIDIFGQYIPQIEMQKKPGLLSRIGKKKEDNSERVANRRENKLEFETAGKRS